jgi:hypothetical protein
VLIVAILLAAFAVVVFAGIASFTFFVPFAHSYLTDVLAFTHGQAQLVVEGHNPYTSDFAFAGVVKQFVNVYPTPMRHGAFGSGYDHPTFLLQRQVRDLYLAAPAASKGGFDPRTLHSYPALSFLVYVPLLWLGIQNILLLNVIVFWGIFAWLLWLSPVGWLHWAALVAGTAVAAVIYSLFLDSEVMCVAPLLVAWRLRQRHPGTSAALLGLACAFKQYSWLFLPFFAIEI